MLNNIFQRLLLLIAIGLPACSSNPEPAKSEVPVVQAASAKHEAEAVKSTTAISARIIVSAKVNPNIDGRPSPVVLRFYELKDLGKFEASDFYRLSQSYEKALGADCLASEQFHVHPSQSKTISYEVSKDTRYVAVTVAYRDLDKAVWRASLPIEANKINKFEILLDALTVSIK